MKVYIGEHKEWIGPYQIARKLMFWSKDEAKIDAFGDWLAWGIYDTHSREKSWLYKACIWLDSKRKRKVKIRIDDYDTWGMNDTLALIILPMLKQLKSTKRGSAYVDDKDVPKELRRKIKAESRWDVDEHHDVRWDWVLDEMIFAFEDMLDPESERKFSTGVIDYKFERCEDNPELFKMVEGDNHTYVTYMKELKKHKKRVQNGFRLFGVYFQDLWD